MFAFLDCVPYNEDFIKSRFIIQRFCSIHFIVILAGLLYGSSFIKLRFHCTLKVTACHLYKK